MGDDPRYTFSPLETRGVLLGLRPAQLAVGGSGALVALIAHHGVPGPASVLVPAVVMPVSLLLALYQRQGAMLGTWLVRGVAWRIRHARGPALSQEPLEGRRPGSAEVKSPARLRRLAGVAVSDHEGAPADRPMAVIHERSGTAAAVLGVSGRNFTLLDPAEQARQLDAWRSVLGALGRSGGPVARLQWVAQSGCVPGHRELLRPDLAPAALDRHGGAPTGGEAAVSDEPAPVGDARRSYRSLVEASADALASTRSWLVVVADAGGRLGRPAASTSRRPAGRSRSPAVETLRREMRFLEGRLRLAGLDPGGPLDRRSLDRLIDESVSGRVPGDGPTAPPVGPLAVDDGWSCCRTDGLWHVTYWVCEWPRVEVGPAFLAPLLLVAARVTVSVLMAPVAADRALRDVRSARTADVADAQLRARAGFLPSVRREREAEAAAQREAELADGHREFRFSGYVRVSATDPDGLAVSCSAVEHAAQAAHLELHRLYGRQEEALAWTLPLGRGLR